MAYLVRLLPNAEAEAEAIYQWLIERAPERGVEWFNSLERVIASFAKQPDALTCFTFGMALESICAILLNVAIAFAARS